MNKITLIILFELLNCSLSYSQISKAIDSTTISTISKLDSNMANKFLELYEYKYSTSFYSRVDTLKYDYVFIEATRCDSATSFELNEWYFKKGNSIPIYLFKNGENINPENEYNDFSNWYRKDITFTYTLKAFRTRCKRLKSIQTLPYARKQIWYHGCVTSEGDLDKFIARKITELKNTYQIQTYINIKKMKTKVSIQIPSKHPHFMVEGHNSVWDF